MRYHPCYSPETEQWIVFISDDKEIEMTEQTTHSTKTLRSMAWELEQDVNGVLGNNVPRTVRDQVFALCDMVREFTMELDGLRVSKDGKGVEQVEPRVSRS